LLVKTFLPVKITYQVTFLPVNGENYWFKRKAGWFEEEPARFYEFYARGFA
jgi:hypothetical protein